MNDRPSGRHGSIFRILKGWATLALLVLALLGFMFYLGPWIAETDFYRPFVQGIQKYGIDINAYYYTDVEQCGEGAHDIRAGLEYPPGGRSK